MAEHAPSDQRGAHTGWIQTSAAFGLMAALGTILATRTIVGEPNFVAWGWRIPFIVSIGLLVVSVYIRTKTAESPTFKALHAQGGLTKTPFRDSFADPKMLGRVFIALFGFMTAQGVIWYTSFFYTQLYLEKAVKLDAPTINYLILGMTLFSAVFYIVFAALSDKIGRKPVMIFGMVLACLAFFPGFKMMLELGNPQLSHAMRATPITIMANPSQCHVQFDPVGKAQFTSPCDLAKSALTNLGVAYSQKPTQAPTASIIIGAHSIEVKDATALSAADLKADKAARTEAIKSALKDANYPLKADPQKANLWGIFAILCVFALACTALYGPMASLLVEMFPTRVRYTALSLPYNIGTGWFGGLLPAVSFAMVAATGDIYFGLFYPVVTGVIAIIVSLIFLKETKGRDLDAVD